MKELMPGSHYPGEMTIQIDSYPAGELFLTHTHTSPVGVALGHLWYNSSSIMGKTSAAPSKTLPIYQEARDSNLPLTHATGSPHILTASRVRTLTTRLLGLS